MECDEEAATLRKEKLEAAQCKLTQAQGLPSSTLATRFAATSTCLGHMNQPLASARQVVF